MLSIGRAWGVANAQAADESETQALLEAAVASGIRIFDTAPAYAGSERRLAGFLRRLTPEIRSRLVVMTKMGEHWDEGAGAPYVDHSRDALIRSLDRSLALLGRIDVLQLHKATEAAVDSSDVRAAFAHARSCGITRFGASVGSVEAGRRALASGLYDCLQFPLNNRNQELSPLVEMLESNQGFPIVNRPYAMGAAIAEAGDGESAGVDAFRFLTGAIRRGVVLTGTGKAAHLAQNVRRFRAAMSKSP